MTFNINDFARKIAQCSFSEIASKYRGAIPKGTKVGDIVHSLEQQELLYQLVRTDWKNDGTDKNGLYLIKADNKFEVFTGERGIKNWKKEFPDIKTACTSFIDSLLNELRYSAPDTKIK